MKLLNMRNSLGPPLNVMQFLLPGAARFFLILDDQAFYDYPFERSSTLHFTLLVIIGIFIVLREFMIGA